MRQYHVRIRFVLGPLMALLFALGSDARGQDASVARPPQGLISEPGIIERAVIFADRRQGNGEFTNGLYPDLWNMIPGAGWIAAGPGYRHWYAKDRIFVDASTAVSWRGYKTAQARLELPTLLDSRLAVGSHFRWQDFTQVSYFGEGHATAVSDRSEYRLRSQNVVGFVTVKPIQSVAIDAQLGWLRPNVLPRGGWFEGEQRDTRSVFPANPVFALEDQPTFAQRLVSVTADTRDFPRHSTRGGLYRVAAAAYDDSLDVFSFSRFEAEAAHFVPVADSRLVFAMRGWLVASRTNPGHVVPFYLQPSLGGDNTLRAYADYRFHDRNMVVVNLEGRIALMTHVDAALFVDAGNVAPRLGDLDLGKRSYGAGLRLHTRRHTFARVDVARGDEGWRMVFRLSDPLDLSRLARRALLVPFLP